MPTTAGGSYYPDSSTSASQATWAAAMAAAEEARFLARTEYYNWADNTARDAQTGMATGDLGFRISPAGMVFRYNGSAWKFWESDWIAYTPTLTNFTIGTGGVGANAAANIAAYRYQAGRIHTRGYAKLGTAGMSVGGAISFTLITNRATLSHNYQACKGSATMYDDSTGNSYSAFIMANITSVSSVLISLPGTNGVRTAASATVPFTWAAGDAISYDFEFDIA